MKPRTVTIMSHPTTEHEIDQVLKLQKAFKNNGGNVRIVDFDTLPLKQEVSDILVVDLDTYDGKDCETLKERLAELATRVLIVCSTSFQRLKYYENFTEVYTSFDNLLEREFFCY